MLLEAFFFMTRLSYVTLFSTIPTTFAPSKPIYLKPQTPPPFPHPQVETKSAKFKWGGVIQQGTKIESHLWKSLNARPETPLSNINLAMAEANGLGAESQTGESDTRHGRVAVLTSSACSRDSARQEMKTFWILHVEWSIYIRDG